MTKEAEIRRMKKTEKALTGLIHCLPAEWRYGGERGCGTCPYREPKGTKYDSMEDVRLPAALVADIRSALLDTAMRDQEICGKALAGETEK